MMEKIKVIKTSRFRLLLLLSNQSWTNVVSVNYRIINIREKHFLLVHIFFIGATVNIFHFNIVNIIYERLSCGHKHNMIMSICLLDVL